MKQNQDLQKRLKSKAQEYKKAFEDELLLPIEAANFLKLSKRTLETMRVRGNGPVFARLGDKKNGAIRYWKSDCYAFAQIGRMSNTSGGQADG